jgi:hypothetical protein
MSDDEITPGQELDEKLENSINPQDFFGKKMPLMSSFVSDPQSSSTIAGLTTQFTDGADEDIRIAEDHFNIDIS